MVLIHGHGWIEHVFFCEKMCHNGSCHLFNAEFCSRPTGPAISCPLKASTLTLW
jgi:hypothetical protein